MENQYTNGVSVTLNVIGNKWKPLIICHLTDGPMRPSALRKALEGISPKVLTEQLQKLEKDDIIFRKTFNEIPLHVEYSLTEYGKSLGPILEKMATWGENHSKIITDKREIIKLTYTDHHTYNKMYEQ